jgi:hypothetical protein
MIILHLPQGLKVPEGVSPLEEVLFLALGGVHGETFDVLPDRRTEPHGFEWTPEEKG